MRESKVIEFHKENVNDQLNFTYFNNRICICLTSGEGVGLNMHPVCKLNQNRQSDVWVYFALFYFLNHFLCNF